MRPQNLVWLVFIGLVISYANEWEDCSNCFGEAVEISSSWATAHFSVSEGQPWDCHGASGCVVLLADVLW